MSASPLVTAVAVAGGVSQGDAAIGGSVIVQNLTLTTHAYLGTSTVVNDTATPNSDQSITIEATDTTTMTNGAGGSGAALGDAGIGIGLDVELITRDTEAYIAPSAVVHAAGDVTIEATSNEQITLVAASAGGRAGEAASSGSILVLVMGSSANDETAAYVDGVAGKVRP